MNALLGISRVIDAVNERIGKLVYWLLLAAVLISSVNAIVRKAFNMSSNAFLEAQWYLFATVFMVGAGYVLLHDQHVRIDILASRLSRRVRAWIEVIGIAFVLLPMCVVIAYMALPTVINAYVTDEYSPNPGGLLRWPLYVMVPIGFGFLFLQGVSELIKDALFLAGKVEDPHAKPEKSDEEILLEELKREAEAAQAAQAAQTPAPGAAR